MLHSICIWYMPPKSLEAWNYCMACIAFFKIIWFMSHEHIWKVAGIFFTVMPPLNVNFTMWKQKTILSRNFKYVEVDFFLQGGASWILGRCDVMYSFQIEQWVWTSHALWARRSRDSQCRVVEPKVAHLNIKYPVTFLLWFWPVIMWQKHPFYVLYYIIKHQSCSIKTSHLAEHFLLSFYRQGKR